MEVVDLQCDTDLRNNFGPYEILNFQNSVYLLIIYQCLVIMRSEGKSFSEARLFVNSYSKNIYVLKH
jgi:hypothetical protein